MNAAQEWDEKEREITRLRREIEKILPYPTTANQRAAIEQAIHMNLSGVGNT